MDRWAEMELFVAVAEMGSMTRAAEALGISTSAASRHLAALEARLNARLLQRTTRSIALTGAGEKFLGDCRDLLNGVVEAEARVGEDAVSPTGLLRVSASLSFCLEHLTPLLPDLLSRHPGLRVELTASNRYYDIIENGIDVAIRTRRVESDSTVTTRRLAETRRLLAASPAYLERHGTPSHPDDLRAHQLLIYSLADRPLEFALSRGGEERVIQVRPHFTANDGQILRRLAVDGMGILAQPTYIIDKDLAAGRLIRVLDDWDLPRLTVAIAYPTRKHLPARVRVFIEFLAATFREENYAGRWMR